MNSLISYGPTSIFPYYSDRVCAFQERNAEKIFVSHSHLDSVDYGCNLLNGGCRRRRPSHRRRLIGGEVQTQAEELAIVVAEGDQVGAPGRLQLQRHRLTAVLLLVAE